MSIVGIDLGTTYCAVSHLDDRGRPITVPNRDGDILTPVRFTSRMTAMPSWGNRRWIWHSNSPNVWRR